MNGITRATAPRRLPAVLSHAEALELSGRREGELELRVKAVDLVRREVIVREGKGAKDRITMFPMSLIDAMKAHLRRVRHVHAADREAGVPGVELPHAYGLKNPAAALDWGWFWV